MNKNNSSYVGGTKFLIIIWPDKGNKILRRINRFPHLKKKICFSSLCFFFSWCWLHVEHTNTQKNFSLIFFLYRHSSFKSLERVSQGESLCVMLFHARRRKVNKRIVITVFLPSSCIPGRFITQQRAPACGGCCFLPVCVGWFSVLQQAERTHDL